MTQSSKKALLGAVIFASLTAASAQSPEPKDARPTTPPQDTRGINPQDTKAVNPHGGAMMGSDNQWILKVAQGGLAEVELGKLAQERGASAAVKKFGQRMVDDHSKANEELSKLAQTKGVTLPTALDSHHQALKDHLSKLDGEAFDRAYMSEMVKDHRTDIAEFQKEATSGRDADAKAFAAKTLPTLQEHLRVAEETSTNVKNASSVKK
jgi:putative membrane protein